MGTEGITRVESCVDGVLVEMEIGTLVTLFFSLFTINLRGKVYNQRKRRKKRNFVIAKGEGK
jgi:hypothetical protein